MKKGSNFHDYRKLLPLYKKIMMIDNAEFVLHLLR